MQNQSRDYVLVPEEDYDGLVSVLLAAVALLAAESEGECGGSLARLQTAVGGMEVPRVH